MDDVHTGQPALALAQKVIQRAEKAGLPADLIPVDITSVSVSADIDAESALRTAALEFVDTVRGVERAIAATRRGDRVPEELDVAPLGEVTEEEWREHWPSGELAINGRPREAAAAEGTTTVAEAPAADESEAASKASGGGSKRRRGRDKAS